MQSLKVLLAVLFLAQTASAFAEELQGVVHVVGSAHNMVTVLAPEGKGDGPELCKNETAKRIARLSGMTVKATGEASKNKDSGKSCLEATAFTVMKTGSGRNAVVGTLTQKDGQFSVTGDDGKQRTLTNIPAGLRKMAGQKVIIDLKPIEGPGAKEAAHKVVSYSAFP